MFEDQLADHAKRMEKRIQGESDRYERRFRRKDGTECWCRVSAASIIDDQKVFQGSFAMFTDISELRHLELQLRQSQKLEAVGHLAGGVAHDFNNLLMVISGYTEIMGRQLRTNDPLGKSLEKIRACTDRASALTYQLLAFSRKQALQPKILNLNSLVQDMEPMLHRLIGENIEIIIRTSANLNNVLVDPGQVEQVLMNLAVNARDAMPKGGKLTIETVNVVLDERYVQSHSEAQVGPHVMLAVSDTGCGMDEKTRFQIFEPFFTTKPKGRGSGLGLSTVYGIVRQSGGTIWVYSEPGQGTTFKVYFPVASQGDGVETVRKESRDLKRDWAGELILVVEDEPILLDLLSALLKEELGFRVHSAANGGEAILAVEEGGIRPIAMITDVVMPGMSGKVLSERLRKTLPDLKVLFMSGYTDNAIVHHGVLDPGIPFLQKPFGVNDLNEKIHALLEVAQ